MRVSIRPKLSHGPSPVSSDPSPSEGTVVRRESIESALTSWRAAERQLTNATPETFDDLTREVVRCRDVFQQLSADHMIEWMAKLTDAESRRSHATPSTLPFHVAARDTQEIAAEIWEAARSSDEDTPETAANRRTTPRPPRPGTN
jgi:hypothetical protein